MDFINNHILSVGEGETLHWFSVSSLLPLWLLMLTKHLFRPFFRGLGETHVSSWDSLLSSKLECASHHLGVNQVAKAA